MIHQKQKILVISGQTATGKTALATKVALQLNGEIVSADSRQVYHGLTCVTGEDLPDAKRSSEHEICVTYNNQTIHISPKIQNGISYWMTDFLDPNEYFSVSFFVTITTSIISSISSRHKLPIIVGGSGLYIRALIDPAYQFTVSPHDDFRRKISEWPLEKLQKEIIENIPDIWEKMNISDKNNPRRLVRVLEKAQAINFTHDPYPQKSEYDVCEITLMKKEDLQTKIDARVEMRIQAGAVTEIQKALRHYDIHLPALSATGCRRFADPRSQTEGTKEYEQAVAAWKQDEYRYAKRQRTWFQKYARGLYVDIDDTDRSEKIEEYIHQWYTTYT